MSDRKHYYSGYKNPEILDEATFKLLEENAEYLINYIYSDDNKNSLLGNPEIRIGLSIKIIHKLIPPVSETILRPVIDDIQMLMDSDKYLASTGNSEKRLKCLEEELAFIQKFVDFDDTITLNIIKPSIKPSKPNKKSDDQGCWIM